MFSLTFTAISNYRSSDSVSGTVPPPFQRESVRKSRLPAHLPGERRPMGRLVTAIAPM